LVIHQYENIESQKLALFCWWSSVKKIKR
jgi:hypothetical protein